MSVPVGIPAMPFRYCNAAEWLEADGLGGFASGTVGGRRTRRYHALLLTATTPPTGRYVLVNGFEAWVDTAAGSFALSSQQYPPDAVYPDGEKRIEAFKPEPWPRWTYRLEDGTRIEHELFMPQGMPAVALHWRLLEGTDQVILRVRPFLSGRDYHALHHENPAFRFEAEREGEKIVWHPYHGVPAIISHSNGEYSPEPVWYRQFLYKQERARGLDDTEDLASPGVICWNLARGDAVWIISVAVGPADCGEALARYETLRQQEQNRRSLFPSRLHRSADAYIVQRGRGKTILAGYPWFTDWGRDTFIALRGLCLATGRLDEARDILVDWAGMVSEGMLPNRFPDHGSAPEFNSVDASLWYIVAVHDFLQACARAGRPVAGVVRERLQEAVKAILAGYAAGTRFNIHVDHDGLLAAGMPGVQLTWMDAKVGDWVVTPRIGKPVEVQALWLNALWIGSQLAAEPEAARWSELFRRGWESFRQRFWNPAGWLYDVVDPDHRPGTAEATFRPNQILAVGGLPLSLLDGSQARSVVDAVEARLLTPLGLRSLAPGERGYAPRYEGGVRQRDGAYHQGTVWPWLMGPFVEAWIRVRGPREETIRQGRQRFLEPLLQHLDEAGIGHVSEIADADPPHTPRGCPFQAWSLGEMLRIRSFV
jgi:predicted glycogen debranching enzyme